MTQGAEFFLTVWSLTLAAIFGFLFRILPKERWQFIAAVPGRKQGDNTYVGINLTWYGFFTAGAIVYAVLLFTVLAAGGGARPLTIMLYGFAILAVAIPASKLVAARVEKRKGTITIGGAAFSALILAPPAAFVPSILGQSSTSSGMLLAALCTAYIAGEGFGRLACLSFGCCYGKKVDDCGPVTKKVFRGLGHRFEGTLKKAAYEGRCEGEQLIPIQGMTAVFYSAVGIVASGLFLNGMYRASFLVSIAAGFLWRFFSEFLRADFRGHSKISAYQIMSVAAVAYAVVISLVFDFASPTHPDIARAVPLLLDARFLLSMQILWAASFLYLGVSTVTRSEIQFSTVSTGLVPASETDAHDALVPNPYLGSEMPSSRSQDSAPTCLSPFQ